MVDGNVLFEHTSCGLRVFPKVELLSAAGEALASCDLTRQGSNLLIARLKELYLDTHLVSHFVQVVFTRYDYNEKVLIASLRCNIKISGSLKNA